MRVLIFSLVIFSFHSLVAQEPIVWSATYQQANKKIVFNAAIEKGWHVYSQFIDPSAGPVPTSFVIDSGKGFSLTGGVVEPKPIVAFDESFEAEVAFFEKNVSFEQKINDLYCSSYALNKLNLFITCTSKSVVLRPVNSPKTFSFSTRNVIELLLIFNKTSLSKV